MYCWNFHLMRHSEVIKRPQEWDVMDTPTEEEIISLWRSLQASGLSRDEAWHAIVTGIALDVAFARSKNRRAVEQ